MTALGLPDWHRISVPAEEMDLLGATATGLLRRHGLQFPCVAHWTVPYLRLAPGGSFVDSHGPDSLWALWRGGRLVQALHRRRLGKADLPALVALLPRAARLRLGRRFIAAQADFAYLRPDARAVAVEQGAEDFAGLSLSARRATLAAMDRPCTLVSNDAFVTLARGHDVRLEFPFVMPEVVAALADAAGSTGWPTPEALLADLVPELPPGRVGANRVDWASLYWGPEALAFTEAWDGTGLDEAVVDPEEVRAAWRRRNMRAGLLLQSAWLAGQDAPPFAGAAAVGALGAR